MKSLRLLRICFAAAFIVLVWGNQVHASRAYPVYSRQGMVVSAEPYATEVGFEILRAGGNAADAAAAAPTGLKTGGWFTGWADGMGIGAGTGH